jgi:hypothetical protein
MKLIYIRNSSLPHLVQQPQITLINHRKFSVQEQI